MEEQFVAKISTTVFSFQILRGLLFVIVIIGIKWLVRDIFNYLSHRLILTEDGVMFRYGLINTKVKEIPYQNINSVEYEQNLFGKFFNYGKLIISTGGDDPDISFNNLHGPRQFKELVNQKLV